MKIGVPRETAAGEKRVATVPDVVEKLVKLGFSVAVQSGAGDAANFGDEVYRAAGAQIVATAAELWAGSDIVVPGVVDEVSSRRVLTMECVAGLTPEEACANDQPQDLRDRWGAVLFDFLLRGLFEHRFLHADPNLSNFSFLPDGRVVVYDFGCVKAAS